MRCQGCGAEELGSPVFCARCGAPLHSGSVLRSADAALARDLGRNSTSATRKGPSTDDTRALIAPAARRTTPQPPAGAVQGAAPVRALHPAEWHGLLVPQADQLSQSKSFVLASPFIVNNLLYRSRLEHVDFHFLPEEPEFNAFATDSEFELPNGKRVEPPAIVFLGGLAAAIRLASAAVATHLARVHANQPAPAKSGLTSTFEALGAELTSTGAILSLKSSLEIFKETVLPSIDPADERFVSAARSLSASMEMYVLAHEAGHIALGHTLAMKELNFDVSRNQEREADSFASSTLSTSFFTEHLFLGQVFVTILFTWQQSVARLSEPSTHPLGRERFRNALETNSEAAKDAAVRLGLTREALVALLPPEVQGTA